MLRRRPLALLCMLASIGKFAEPCATVEAELPCSADHAAYSGRRRRLASLATATASRSTARRREVTGTVKFRLREKPRSGQSKSTMIGMLWRPLLNSRKRSLKSFSAFATRGRYHEEALACCRRWPRPLHHERRGSALSQGLAAAASVFSCGFMD